jgi:hypothetical protein
MQSLDGELVLSATDLVGFAECVHRTVLDAAKPGTTAQIGP